MEIISVIIPTYNRADYIVDAIDSVLAQKLPSGYKLEVIVVDDGSIDKTEEILKVFKAKIHYIKIRHSGRPAVPRNVGLKVAHGNLVAFQDSDDLWAEDKLINQLPLFKERGVVLSFGNANTMTANGSRQKNTIIESKKLHQGEKFSTLIKDNLISTLTVVARKEVLVKAGGFNENMSLKAVEDYELWLKVAAEHPRGLKSIDRVLATYRQHKGNISTADPILAMNRLLAVYNSIWTNSYLSNIQGQALEKQIEIAHENWGRLQSLDGKTPAVSVVMSVYNGEEFLRQSIDSILQQSFKNFEFIIIDDGSSDKSAQIISSYEDKRIRLVSQSNHGLVAALNKGLHLARGTYIARQDADDISLPHRFQKEVDWLSADSKRGLVSSFFTYIDSQEKTSITLTFPTKHIDLMRMLYYTNPFGHGCALIRREAVVGLGGYRDTYDHNEDYDLWQRLGQHWLTGVLPEVLYLYRINQKSISHTNQDRQHAAARKLVESLWKRPVPLKQPSDIIQDAKFYDELGRKYQPTIRQQYVGLQVQLANDCLRRNRLKVGYTTALAALYLQPRSIFKLFWPLITALPRRIIKT